MLPCTSSHLFLITLKVCCIIPISQWGRMKSSVWVTCWETTYLLAARAGIWIQVFSLQAMDLSPSSFPSTTCASKVRRSKLKIQKNEALFVASNDYDLLNNLLCLVRKKNSLDTNNGNPNCTRELYRIQKEIFLRKGIFYRILKRDLLTQIMEKFRRNWF